MTTLARVVFLALVAATFGAFFVAQRLKGAPPVVQLQGQRWFSPNGDGRKDRAELTLRVRESDTLTADLIDAAGTPGPAARDRAPRSARRAPCALRWDGRDGRRRDRARRRLPRARHACSRQGRSVVNPKLITLDTTPPRPRVVEHQARPGRRPEGAARWRSASAASRRRSATRFRVIRTDAGAPQLVAKGTPRARPAALDLERPLGRRARAGGRLRRAGARARPRGQRRQQPGAGAVRRRRLARPGRHHRALARRAAAAAPGHRGREGGLLRRLPRAPVPLGDPAGRRQAARAPRQGRRRAPRARCALRAPRGKSGLYLVELAVGRAAGPRCRSSCRRASGRRCSSSCRRITWLGTDPVDDPPLRDGMPDTLDRAGGGRVRWPRVFAGEDGKPAGLLDPGRAAACATSTATGIRYDLTSDLDLALSDSPRASDRKAVLLAGSMRWVTRPLARRLRRYVQDGGRLATFGPDTLRRGVTIRAERRRDGGRAAAADPAERPGPVRRAAGAAAPRQGAGADRPARRRPRLRAVRGHRRHARRLQRVRGVRAARGGRQGDAAGRDGRRAAGARPRRPGRRAAAGAALRADRDAAGREGADHPRRPAGVDAAARRSRRSRRSRATSSTCCAARSRRSASRAAARARSRAARSRSPSASMRSHSGRLRSRAGRRPRRRRSAARRARPPPRAGRPRRSPPYQSSASGCSASSARASGYWAASKTTTARGWPGSAIRRAWPAAIRSRSRPGSRPVAP